MAETRIPFARCLMTRLENENEDDFSDRAWPLCLVNNKLIVFQDWYRYTDHYEAPYTTSWGNYRGSGTWKRNHVWRDPFEERPSAPEDNDASYISVNLPSVYYIGRGDYSTEKFRSVVDLCEAHYGIEFEVGDKNAVGYDKNSLSSKILDGYLCATRTYRSSDGITDEIKEKYGKNITHGGVAIKLVQEYFTDSDGYVMCSFVNNDHWEMSYSQQDNYVKCYGICLYDNFSTVALHTDIIDPMFFDIPFYFIDREYPLSPSYEVRYRSARYDNILDHSASTGRVGTGVLASAGAPTESSYHWTLTSTTKELMIKED